MAPDAITAEEVGTEGPQVPARPRQPIHVLLLPQVSSLILKHILRGSNNPRKSALQFRTVCFDWKRSVDLHLPILFTLKDIRAPTLTPVADQLLYIPNKDLSEHDRDLGYEDLRFPVNVICEGMFLEEDLHTIKASRVNIKGLSIKKEEGKLANFSLFEEYLRDIRKGIFTSRLLHVLTPDLFQNLTELTVVPTGLMNDPELAKSNLSGIIRRQAAVLTKLFERVSDFKIMNIESQEELDDFKRILVNLSSHLQNLTLLRVQSDLRLWFPRLPKVERLTLGNLTISLRCIGRRIFPKLTLLSLSSLDSFMTKKQGPAFLQNPRVFTLRLKDSQLVKEDDLQRVGLKYYCPLVRNVSLNGFVSDEIVQTVIATYPALQYMTISSGVDSLPSNRFNLSSTPNISNLMNLKILNINRNINNDPTSNPVPIDWLIAREGIMTLQQLEQLGLDYFQDIDLVELEGLMNLSSVRLRFCTTSSPLSNEHTYNLTYFSSSYNTAT